MLEVKFFLEDSRRTPTRPPAKFPPSNSDEVTSQKDKVFFQKNTFFRELTIFPNYFLNSKKRLHSDKETTFLWNNIIWYALYSISLLSPILKKKTFFPKKHIFPKKPKRSNILRNLTIPVAFFGKLVVSICFLFQSWWVNSVSDAPSVLFLNSELTLVAGGTMATVRVDPPALSDSGDYNQWKNKVVMWRELTLLDKKKQAFSIIFALSGKAEQIALEMDHNQLKQDDGVDKLTEELDKFFAKNETDLSYAAYKDFDQFVRTSEMKMSEYVSSFEQKYNKAKKHKLEMSDSVLAFKLLDNAFLDNTKKQMVLTACPAIKFDDMKSALNRIFNGEQSNSSEGDVAMKEEVLYTSSIFKSRGFPPRRGGGSRNRGSFGRGRAVVPRGSLRPQTSLTKNPVFHGEVSRCNICESVYHYAINCPHRQQEANLTANTDEEGEQDVETVDLVLVNGSDVPAEIFTTEAMKLAILDTACTRTVCGKPWLDNFLQDLTLDQKSQIVFEQSNAPFRFGDAPVVCSTEKRKCVFHWKLDIRTAFWKRKLSTETFRYYWARKRWRRHKRKLTWLLTKSPW